MRTVSFFLIVLLLPLAAAIAQQKSSPAYAASLREAIRIIPSIGKYDSPEQKAFNQKYMEITNANPSATYYEGLPLLITSYTLAKPMDARLNLKMFNLPFANPHSEIVLIREFTRILSQSESANLPDSQIHLAIEALKARAAIIER